MPETPLENNQQSRAERSRRLRDDDDAVMTFMEWCDLNGFSRATGIRIKNSGNGPRFIQMSPRRIGITRRDNRIWQDKSAK
jgi:hypothetical protein